MIGSTPVAPDVAKVLAGYPANIQKKLLQIRRMIFKIGSSNPHIGAIQETLKWGEPAYLTPETKSGSTIRLAWKESTPHQYGVYFICTSGLVDSFRAQFGDVFTYEKNRALILDATARAPMPALAACLKQALLYHHNKR